MHPHKTFYESLSTLVEASDRVHCADLAVETLDYCLEGLRCLQVQARARADLERNHWRPVTDLMMVVDTDGQIVDANLGMARALGCAVEDVVGRSAWDLIPPCRRQRRRQELASVVLLGRPLAYETETVWGRVEIVMQPVGAEYGIGLVVCMLRILEGRGRRWTRVGTDGEPHRARIIE